MMASIKMAGSDYILHCPILVNINQRQFRIELFMDSSSLEWFHESMSTDSFLITMMPIDFTTGTDSTDETKFIKWVFSGVKYIGMDNICLNDYDYNNRTSKIPKMMVWYSFEGSELLYDLLNPEAIIKLG